MIQEWILYLQFRCRNLGRFSSSGNRGRRKTGISRWPHDDDKINLWVWLDSAEYKEVFWCLKIEERVPGRRGSNRWFGGVLKGVRWWLHGGQNPVRGWGCVACGWRKSEGEQRCLLNTFVGLSQVAGGRRRGWSEVVYGGRWKGKKVWRMYDIGPWGY